MYGYCVVVYTSNMEPDPNRGQESDADSQDNEDDFSQNRPLTDVSAFEIFSVKQPPRKRARGSTANTQSSTRAPKRAPKKKVTIAKPEVGESSSAGGGGSGPANNASDPQSTGKIGVPISKATVTERGNDLLDHRDMPDADELFSENEHALTNFLRLHPQLSLDATSDRTMSAAAALLGDCAVKTRELENCSKTHDDKFLRPPNLEIGERPCVNGEKCICKWLAVFRYGESSKHAFVCREFLLPSQLDIFNRTGSLPKTHGKCLLCCRYFSTYVYTLARNSPNFKPNGCLALQAFGNTINVDDVESETLTYSNDVEGEEGYSASVMLFADERWAELASSHGNLGTLLWRPVVRFKSSDYKFETNKTTGTPLIVQVAMESERKEKTLDFFQPSSSTAAAMRAQSD